MCTSPDTFPGYTEPASDQHFTVDFERTSLYFYDFWRATPWLTLIGGVAYDKMTYPENFRSPPLSDNEQHLNQVSPKAAFILQPHRSTIIRGAYTQSISTKAPCCLARRTTAGMS